jgi:hypothetical protein
MEQVPEATLTLSVAAEHYMDGTRRGVTVGKAQELDRLVSLLQKHGHYESVLLIKKHSTTR